VKSSIKALTSSLPFATINIVIVDINYDGAAPSGVDGVSDNGFAARMAASWLLGGREDRSVAPQRFS